MPEALPDLSRFELQCLRRIQTRGEASARDIQSDLPHEAGYSTVRKIIERLEQKGVVERVRLEGKAWIYRSGIPSSTLIKKEIRQFLDTLFGGSAAPLIAHLADMDALTLEDLEALDQHIRSGEPETPDGGNEDREDNATLEYSQSLDHSSLQAGHATGEYVTPQMTSSTGENPISQTSVSPRKFSTAQPTASTGDTSDAQESGARLQIADAPSPKQSPSPSGRKP